MKILLCHNHYQQSGGEDRVFADEGTLLESRGHQVLRFTMHNDAIKQMRRIDVAKKTLWNADAACGLRDLIRRDRPEVMHCTNVFPLISPAAYYTAKDEGVAVVQSLHNYRMICPKAQFVRKGKVCQECLGKSIAWPAVLHGCYRENRAASALVTLMLSLQQRKKTWVNAVDRFIAPTQFVKDKHVEAGLPATRIDVKPNFVFPDPGRGPGGGNYAVFAGRLSPEKGVETLLQGWSRLGSDLNLKILGDGPLAGRVQEAAEQDSRIQWLGRRAPGEVLSILGQAECLVMPSICFETFGLSIAEAFAKGTPVIASDLGALAELVDDGRTGFLFRANDPHDLARKVQQLRESPPKQFRHDARAAYQTNYTAETNYEMLVQIYARAVSPPLMPHFSSAC